MTCAVQVLQKGAQDSTSTEKDAGFSARVGERVVHRHFEI